jgi:hypothetical protein
MLPRPQTRGESYETDDGMRPRFRFKSAEHELTSR